MLSILSGKPTQRVTGGTCVLCESDKNVRRTLAYSKAGKWIKESRVFGIATCEDCQPQAEQSFETPFRDRDVINLYKKTIRIETDNVGLAH